MNKIIIDKINRAIPTLKFIYLFGSSTTPHFNQESDVDIAFFSDSEPTSVSLWDLAQDLAVALNRDVDLINLKTCSESLRNQILNTGTCVYSINESERHYYEMVWTSMYLHFNEERKTLLNDIEKRGTVYG